MSEKELSKEQLLDEMISLTVSIGHKDPVGDMHDTRDAVKRLTEIAERLAPPKKEVRESRSASIRRADPEEVKEWEDPYAREPREPRWWEVDLTPEELARRSETWEKYREELKKDEENLPRRLRLECFLNDWRMAVVTKKVEKDEVIDALWDELYVNAEPHTRWTSMDEGLTGDIEKIEEVMARYNASVGFAVTELRRSGAHPSLTANELTQVPLDWRPEVSIKDLPGAFGEWPEPAKPDPISTGVQAHILASALFEQADLTQEQVINNIARDLMAEMDANPLAEFDMQRVQLFRRLARLSLELAEVTGELFKEQEESELARERRLRKEEFMREPAVQRLAEVIAETEVEDEDVDTEEGIGWKAPLASLLVAAVAKAAQNHFKQKAEESIAESIEAEHGS